MEQDLQRSGKIRLSSRLEGVSESATLRLNALVQSMVAQGIDVVNLTAGEPDYWVPDAAKKAAIDAVTANKSRYTPAAGIPDLRQAISEKTNAEQPSLSRTHPWKSSNVVVTNGGKQAVFNSLMALLDPGDEVLILSPYWLSYPEMVKIAGGIPKFIPGSFAQGFKVTAEQIRSALGPRVRALILNSPSNPTGATYTRKELALIAEVLQSPAGENVWVISDEIYDRIILGETPFCSFLEAAPELFERTVTVNGMSKTFAMTGWRIGWSVASSPITQAMITLQGQCTSGINAPAQWASLAALELPESAMEPQISRFRKRRDLALEILGKASKMELVAPEGAFYFFAGVGKYFRDGEDSIGFAERLLQTARVAVVPGTPFGEPEFIRISFATDDRSLQEGCERLVRFLR